jgi:RNA polymerase sigma factor (sigma-70 family)
MGKRATAVLGRAIRAAVGGGLAALSDGELLQRFAAEDDQAAFAALVRRHAAMVLGVCRRALPTLEDAEDACQATFLVLAQKARGTRWQSSVANWLFSTARKVARNARVAAQRRARREARAGVPEAVAPAEQVSARELLAALDEELDKLPPSCREPLVLCYLEGLTRDEAAARLGVPPGTLKGRLKRGRQRLGDALARRGWGLGAGLPALAATSAAGASPPRLVHAVVAAAGLPPPAVAALAKGLAVKKWLNKWLLGVLAVLGAGVLGIGLWYRTPKGPGTPAETERAAKVGKPVPKPPADKDAIAYGGRVLGPDGRPVAGARLYLTRAIVYSNRSASSPEYARTGPDGRFRFTASKAQFGDWFTCVGATAANHGVGWVEVSSTGKRDGLTLRLVADDQPVTGEIVDLEGKPVPGATLTVLAIHAAPGEDLGPWLAAAQVKKGLKFQREQEQLRGYNVPVPMQVKTDAGGKLRLGGIGRNRLIRARLDGPTIASQYLDIITRPGKPVEVPQGKGKGRRVTTYHAANFRHAAAASKPIVGVVRDKDTRKPLAGVTIQSYKLANSSTPGMDIAQATTDAKGRFRLTGMPKGKGNKIVAIPDKGRSYLVSFRDVPDSPGLDPVVVDIDLKRGVWIEGKITDKVTGKPLKGSVEYYALASNPNLHDYPGFGGDGLGAAAGYFSVAAKEDGSYRVVGLPGPGLVVVFNTGRHLLAPERDDEYGFKGPGASTLPYQMAPPFNYTAIARINPDKGAEKLKRDLTLDSGWTWTGTVRGPGGKPLAGARAFGLTGDFWYREVLKTAEFTVRRYNPGRPRAVLFRCPEKGLVGMAQPPKTNGASGPVRLTRGAVVTGRLLDADGEPRAGVELAVSFRRKEGPQWWSDYSLERIRTDREGRFRIPALLPGYEFRLSDGKGELRLGSALRPGRTKGLGDVQLELAKE